MSLGRFQLEPRLSYPGPVPGPLDAIFDEYLGKFPLGGVEERVTWIAAREALERATLNDGRIRASPAALFDAVQYLRAGNRPETADIFITFFDDRTKAAAAQELDKYQSRGSVLLRQAVMRQDQYHVPRRPLVVAGPHDRMEYVLSHDESSWRKLSRDSLRILTDMAANYSPVVRPVPFARSTVNQHFRAGDVMYSISRDDDHTGRGTRLAHGAHISDSLPLEVGAFEVLTVEQSRFATGIATIYVPGRTLTSVVRRGRLTIPTGNMLGQMGDILHTVHNLELSRTRWPNEPPEQPKFWEDGLYSGLFLGTFEKDLQFLLSRGEIERETMSRLVAKHRRLSAAVGIDCERPETGQLWQHDNAVPVEFDPHLSNWRITGKRLRLSDWEFAQRAPAVVDTYKALRSMTFVAPELLGEDDMPGFIARSSGMPVETALQFCSLLEIVRQARFLAGTERHGVTRFADITPSLAPNWREETLKHLEAMSVDQGLFDGSGDIASIGQGIAPPTLARNS